jgi:hypothetical protein
MLDSKPTSEGGQRAPASNSGGDLPEYEYNPADEEVPF